MRYLRIIIEFARIIFGSIFFLAGVAVVALFVYLGIIDYSHYMQCDLGDNCTWFGFLVTVAELGGDSWYMAILPACAGPLLGFAIMYLGHLIMGREVMGGPARRHRLEPIRPRRPERLILPPPVRRR